jgi:hypothetical protein
MELTIKLDQRKKEAKALIEFLRNLPFVEVETKEDLSKTELNNLSVKEQKFVANLRNVAKDVKQNVGKKKYQSLDSFLDEI